MYVWSHWLCSVLRGSIKTTVFFPSSSRRCSSWLIIIVSPNRFRSTALHFRFYNKIICLILSAFLGSESLATEWIKKEKDSPLPLDVNIIIISS